ncbi:hypothetical protein AAEX28_10560 [Lentisphaerota bacterium WC36G]|nr:hypothetical protein LJT99_13405 [Lentisphaerae bacterium WC36]
MRSLLGIIKVTCKSAIRSHIFQLLLALLTICVFILPYTIVGDGTAVGFIRISLQYSLSVVSFILVLESIWLGCFVMGRDTETYQIHMVICKPVSRVKIWLGKWLGVVFINFVLLFTSAVVIFSLVYWKFNTQKFAKGDKERVRNEILVGRKTYTREIKDVDKEAMRLTDQRIKDLKASGNDISENKQEIGKIYAKMQETAAKAFSEVKVGEYTDWTFKNIPTNLPKDTKLFLRFKPFLDQISTKKQRDSAGGFQIQVLDAAQINAKKGQAKQYSWVRFGDPMTFMTSVEHEINIPLQAIKDDGTVIIRFFNLDFTKDADPKSLFFQRSDGPFLLVKEIGFFNNYLRAVSILFFMICGIAGISCAFGGIMSIPTAIFTVSAYVVFGVIANYFTADSFYVGASTVNKMMVYISDSILYLIIPIQNFDMSAMLASGQLIEMAVVGNVVLKYLILRALPIMFVGMWLYYRKEMGLVIRK